MTQLTENLFAVEVPDNAYGFELDNPLQYGELVYYLDYPSVYNFRFVALPPGTWQLLCTTKEATWLQAAGIVEHYRGGFVNYESNSVPKVAAYPTPFVSLNSLITSKGLDVNKNYCLLKKEK